MPAADASDVTFDKTLKLVEVASSTFDSIPIQELVDACADYQDEVINLDIPKLFDASGKDELGGGDLKPITMTFNDGWLFIGPADYAALQIFTVDGGTLLGPSNTTPFAPQLNITYDRAKGQEGKLLDSSAITTSLATIDARQVIIAKVQQNRIVTDPVTGVITVYDDDDVTPLFTADIFESTDSDQPYRGDGIDAKDRLT